MSSVFSPDKLLILLSNTLFRQKYYPIYCLLSYITFIVLIFPLFFKNSSKIFLYIKRGVCFPPLDFPVIYFFPEFKTLFFAGPMERANFYLLLLSVLLCNVFCNENMIIATQRILVSMQMSLRSFYNWWNNRNKFFFRNTVCINKESNAFIHKLWIVITVFSKTD